MEGQRFDEFVRSFHAAGSRRRALTALLAGTGISLLPSLAAEAGKKKKKKKKTICHCPSDDPADCVTLKLKKKQAKKHLKKHANDFAGPCPGGCVPGGDCDTSADCCAEGEECVAGTCSLSICQAAVCDTFVSCTDDPELVCACFSRPASEGNAGFCGDGGCGDCGLCDQLAACESSAECPTGYFCAVDTCCSAEGVCIGVCGTCGICNDDAEAKAGRGANARPSPARR